MELVVIILLLLVAVVIYGISYYIKEQSRKHKRLALALAYEHAVMKHKLSIEYFDVFNNRIIALDRKNRQLLFLYHKANGKQEELVLLSEVAQSQLVEVRDEQKGLIRKVYLELTHKVEGTTSLLCFYDEQQDKPIALLSLMRKARSWKQRLDGNMNPGIITIVPESDSLKENKVSLKNK